MDIIITYIETIIYFVSLTAISQRILGATISKRKYFLSLIYFILLLCSIVSMNQKHAMIILQLSQAAEIVLLRLCCTNIRLLSIIYQYILLFSIAVCVISFLKIIFFISIPYEWYLELAVNTLLMFICLFISIKSSKNKVRIIVGIFSLPIKLVILCILMVCALLSVLIANDYITRENEYWNSFSKILIVGLLFLVALIIPALIIYFATNKFIKNINNSYKNQINAQALRYINISESIHELRRFKHNYKNTNIALMKLLSEGKSEEALKLLEAQNQELNSTSVQFDTGNGIVDAMLTDKQNQADKINTTIKFEGAVPRNAIDAVDLCIIFGNPLDNAIEACAEIDAEAPKEIHISCACNSGFAFIEITNPVQHKVEIRGNLPETTKPDKEMHGFGLYSLEKVIKKYDGEVTCECDETTFKLSMEFNIPVRGS